MKLTFLLLAAGCAALAASLFLVFEVERGATSNALTQYLLAFLVAGVLPGVLTAAVRLALPWKGFAAACLTFAALAATVALAFAGLLLTNAPVA